MVPLDGSEKDPRALAVARALARLSGSDLHLVEVIERPSGRLTAQAEFIGVDQAAVTGRRDVETRLADVATRISLDAGPATSFAILEGKHVAEELIRYVVRCEPRAVVMATRAPRTAEISPGGSIAAQLVRESVRPVVLVPPGAEFDNESVPRIRRVLVPLDGSDLATRSIDFLLELPHAADVEYVLVQVVSAGYAHTSASLRLEAMATHMRARGVSTIYVFVMDADEKADAIVAATRQHACDFIAMSTRGLSGLELVMLGSVAEGVVRKSDVPVLLLTPTMLKLEDGIPIAAATTHDQDGSPPWRRDAG